MAPSNLTFAEAMALDPSDVEVLCNLEWRPLREEPSNWTWCQLRACSFRRARPRRSRVQEMAAKHGCEGPCARSIVADMTHAIRAVCEYVNKRSFNDARDIEREFLEER